MRNPLAILHDREEARFRETWNTVLANSRQKEGDHIGFTLLRYRALSAFQTVQRSEIELRYYADWRIPFAITEYATLN